MSPLFTHRLSSMLAHCYCSPTSSTSESPSTMFQAFTSAAELISKDILKWVQIYAWPKAKGKEMEVGGHPTRGGRY